MSHTPKSPDQVTISPNFEPAYSELLTVFYQIVQSRVGDKFLPGESWKSDTQSLARKLFRHLISIKALCEVRNDCPPGMLPIAYVDHSSVQVVARAAIETFLVYFYIYGGDDLQRSKFRHSTWYLAGLLDRQKLTPLALPSEFKEKLAADKQEIHRLRNEISISRYFEKYSPKQQKQLLEGVWKVGIGWGELAVSAGFNKSYFDNMYSHSCGYSHSSYISSMQGAQARDLETQQMLANVNLGYGIQIMTHFIKSYAGNVSSASEILENDIHARNLVERWHFDAQSWEDQINRASSSNL